MFALWISIEPFSLLNHAETSILVPSYCLHAHVFVNVMCTAYSVVHVCVPVHCICMGFRDKCIQKAALMSIRVHLSPGSPYVNSLYKYHVLSLWHTFRMGHAANFLLVRFHV